MSWLEAMLDRMTNAEREGAPRENVAETVFDAMASNTRNADDVDDLVY